MPPTFAVIPTHNRHEMLSRLIDSCGNSTVIVLDNASTPPVIEDRENVFVFRDMEQPPNLYRLWNVGFDKAELIARNLGNETWNVAVFNDDTVLPPGWFTAVEDALRSSVAAVACGSENHSQTSPILKTELRRFPRMTPHAFMVKGELGLRADESMRWWWGDNDFDFQATLAGGIQIIPGYVATNSCANSTTVGKLAEQAGRDGRTFALKWNGRY